MRALSVSVCCFLFLHTHTPQEGIPFVEVAVCWCVDDVARGGGALAGSGLRAVVCYLSGNFSSGMIEPGPAAASLGGLCCGRKRDGSGSAGTSGSAVSLRALLYKGVNWISL